jgi:hypothetical protein
MTAQAEWFARYVHTSVIDAGGGIYVLGGGADDGYTDVWRSADQGEADEAHVCMRVCACVLVCLRARARARVC